MFRADETQAWLTDPGAVTRPHCIAFFFFLISVSGLPQLCDARLHGGQPHPGAFHHSLQQRIPVDPAHGAQQAHRPAESCRRLTLHQGCAGLFTGAFTSTARRN